MSFSDSPNGPRFTDEDLKRLKEKIADADLIESRDPNMTVTEIKGVLARLDDSELINEMLIKIFKSAMSDDSNTGKVIRLQQVAMKLEFMAQSEDNKQLVLKEFRAWRIAFSASGGASGKDEGAG